MQQTEERLARATAYCALAKRLRLTADCDISTPTPRRVACERTYAPLTIALVECDDGHHALTLTHRPTGLALHFCLYRRGVPLFAHYEIPATPAGAKAARAMLSVLLALPVDWSLGAKDLKAAHPDIPARAHAATWPHFEALADAQDRVAMREYRAKLSREHTGRGSAQWITNRVHERFWWQGGKMWAISDEEHAEVDARLAGHDDRLDGKAGRR